NMKSLRSGRECKDNIIVVQSIMANGNAKEKVYLTGHPATVHKIIREFPQGDCSSCQKKGGSQPDEEPVFRGVKVRVHLCHKGNCARDAKMLLEYGLPSILHQFGYRLGGINTGPP
ncbi:unnamed protein product, partial [Owenia fusiformis]